MILPYRKGREVTMSKKKQAIKVTPKMPRCVAADYAEPYLHRVSTKIEIDGQSFQPEYIDDSPVVALKAKLDEGPLRLPHRGIATIDCGCSIELPPGYKATFAVGGVYKARGLFVISGSWSKNVEVTVINLGREIIQVNNGDVCAEMALEVVHWFDWIF